MIYELVPANAPIRQGDVFQSVPYLRFNPEKMAVLRRTPQPALLNYDTNWLKEIQNGSQEIELALVNIRPAYGIVATQDCDTQRDQFIALFEVADFVQRTGLQVNQKNPIRWWTDTLTKKARINDKWFYLPPDENLGWHDKMVADFQTIITVPTTFLVNHRSQLRMGRLNAEADEHFREKVAHYFRRYPYDEWYPLNKEEFQAYRSSTSEDVSPRPWQE